MKTLTDEDIDAIVNRLLPTLGKRLLAAELPAVAPQSPPRAEPPRERPPKLAYTLKELCAEMSVSPATIYRLVVRRLLKPLPYLRTKIFTRAEVERVLAEGMDWNTAGRPTRRGRPGAT